MHFQFEHSLTARDAKRQLPHRFIVPADSTHLEIDFEFTPGSAHGITNLLTLSLYDPNGFRGAGHREGQRHWVRLSSAEATPGYLPGPLPGGEWVVEIDTHMIMPGEPVRYRLEVRITDGALPSLGDERATPAPTSQISPTRAAGWYRGDLHSHSHHSDAPEQAAAELVAAAQAAGLDFVFLTDHNTVAGLAEVDALACEDLLTAGGIELTTFWGHALCLGARQWVDWRVRPGTGDMARIAAETHGRGEVFVICHPQSVGDPACTGCTWRYGEMMPGNARAVEIWNGPWAGDSGNEAALALWYDWLNQGLRLVATAGSDTHGPRDYAAGAGFCVIYAEALTEAGLLSAVRAGHLYLSAGPTLTLEAQDADGNTRLMGDTVTGPATLAATWAGWPAGARVRLMANGRVWALQPAGGEGSREWRITPEKADWIVVEIRGAQGGVLAITNPVFFERADHPAEPQQERE